MSPAVKWILAIVGLLVANVVAMVILMVSANTSKADVIPNYYDKAAHYDDAIDEAARSEALGWTATAQLAATAVDVVVRDRSGAALDGATVRVTGYARADAKRGLDVTLAASGAGQYRGALPAVARGVHDVTIAVERGGDRFVARATVEAAP